MKLNNNSIINNTKQDRAITLIALVVTIIILLILAGVTIGFAMNGTGLFDKAKLATDKYNNKVQEETIDIQKNTNEIDSHIYGDRENNKISYSLDEQVVGTWTDGKPIYQKTVEGLNVKMNWVGTHAYTSCSITAPAANVKKVINARAYMSSSSNGFENWSQVASINIGSENSTSWTVACLEDYYLRGLTVQYTKTTD